MSEEIIMSDPSFKDQFKVFSKFGAAGSDGKQITLTQSDKWLKQAQIIDGKKVTTTDTGICFKKFRKQKLAFDDYNKYIDDLAKAKQLDAEDIKAQLAACVAPDVSGTTSAVKVGGVERLTDTSKYTGASKQRFDASGKGRGLAGREYIADSSGYVQGYKEKGAYNKKHPRR
jgi:hypothetical protein